MRAYLDVERAEGDADVGIDVLALAPEDRVLGGGEDVVLVPAAVVVARDRVVDHEPLVDVYSLEMLVLWHDPSQCRGSLIIVGQATREGKPLVSTA